MSILLWVMSCLGITALMVSLFANLYAISPSTIESLNSPQAKPLPVQLPAAKKEEPPPLESSPEPSNSMLDMSPTASADFTELSGIAFGSHGSGPSIAGNGGFGTDSNSLMREQTAVTRPPKAVFKMSPEYPSEARSRGISGFVVLRLLVGLAGTVEDIKIEQSEPRGFFDSAALKAARSWRFEPALHKGSAIVAWTNQKIKFELN